MKKWVSWVLYGTLTVASCVAVFFGTKLIIEGTNKTTVQKVPPFDWKDYSSTEREFFERNSYKVWFQSGVELRPQGEMVSYSQGTAWSFYIDDQSSGNFVDWYLMTNFHVVNAPLWFNTGMPAYGQVPNHQAYPHVVNINSQFCLQDTSNASYRSLFSKDIGYNLNNLGFGKGLIDNNANVSVITDNSLIANSGDTLDLFSNSIANPANSSSSFYNLDMALIKIRMTKANYNKQIGYFNQIADPYGYWLNNRATAEKQIKIQTVRKNLKIDGRIENHAVNVQPFTISGNPGSQNRLVAQNISGDSMYEENIYTKNGVEWNDKSTPEPVYFPYLQKLQARNYRTQFALKPWILSAGASGSAVYQGSSVKNNASNPKSVVPVGIYWGGGTPVGDPDAFIPMFTPFINEQYNIFSNFQEALKKGFN